MPIYWSLRICVIATYSLSEIHHNFRSIDGQWANFFKCVKCYLL